MKLLLLSIFKMKKFWKYVCLDIKIIDTVKLMIDNTNLETDVVAKKLKDYFNL